MTQMEEIQKRSRESQVLLTAGWVVEEGEWYHPIYNTPKLDRGTALITEYNKRMGF